MARNTFPDLGLKLFILWMPSILLTTSPPNLGLKLYILWIPSILLTTSPPHPMDGLELDNGRTKEKLKVVKFLLVLPLFPNSFA